MGTNANMVSNLVCLDFSEHSDDGARAFQRLRSICDQTQGERDSLRAECEALRAALEMYQRAMLAAAQNHALSSQERAAYENAQLALSQGGRK